MVEVDHDPEADTRPGFMKFVQHIDKGFIKPIGIERQLLGSDTNALNARLGQCCQPRGNIFISQHQGIATRHQDLPQLFSTGIRVPAAILGNHLVVLIHVSNDITDLREAFGRYSSIGALHLLFGN